MPKYLLDTDTCIHAMRHNDPVLRARFTEQSDALAMATVTLAELSYGAQKTSRPERNRRIAKDLAARVEVIPMSLEVALQAGEIRAELERVGVEMDAYSIMIAATARAHGLVIITRNTKGFSQIPGLRLENWRG